MANEELVESLNALLADVFALYVRAHGFHWNVEGEDFAQYHELFETIYEDVYGSIDPIAENVRKLDGKALSSLPEISDASDLSETGDAATAPGALAEELLGINDKVLQKLNAAFKIANDTNEQGIANFLAERIDMHQKWRWQLSASLSKTSSEGQDMSDITPDDVKKAMLGAPESCENCGGKDFEPYTAGVPGGAMTFPLCKGCNQVSIPAHWGWNKTTSAPKTDGTDGTEYSHKIEDYATDLAEYIDGYVGNEYRDGDEGSNIFSRNSVTESAGSPDAFHRALQAVDTGRYTQEHLADIDSYISALESRVSDIGPDFGRGSDDENFEAIGGYTPSTFRQNIMQELQQRTVSDDDSREASVKIALENPFDGYGRPFSEDPLNPNMDPAYYGDNPASDTKPYAGPNSYSINTTAPYMPPNSGMEDPGQNVGPYNPPGYEQEMDAAEERTAKTYDAWNSETEWFDGTSDSIYRRISSAREIQKTADKATANIIEQQIRTLEKVANEFADSSLAEYMSNVPGGTVAMEYDDLTDGGLVDVTSFISTEAHKYIEEVNSYDWERFAKDAPRLWVSSKAKDNPGILANERQTREAAVDYVKSKTMVLMDPVLRADIIDNFVSDVEVARRSHTAAATKEAAAEAARRDEFNRRQKERIAAELSELEYPEEFFPGQTVVGSNDPFDFGADDGSALYEDAKQVVEAHRNRDWEAFCVEGARDWFFSNDTGKHSIYRYADTTRYAAKQYVEDETTLVKDVTLKNEIKRAFLESVDYLREEWAEKQAAAEEEDEGNLDVLSQYYDDETLW